MNGSNKCDMEDYPRDIYCYPHSEVCVRPTLVGIQIVFLVCIIILSMTSCALLIYVVHRTKSMTTSMKACILSLSTAYLLSSVYPIPILCYSIVYSHLVLADIVCRSSPIVVMVTSISTNWTLALIGMDRFLTIFRPFTHSLTMDFRKSLAMVMSTWCIGIMFSVPPCFGWGGISICFQPRSLQICGITWITSRAFSYTTWCLTVMVPLCLLIFCYLKIALLARSLIDPCHRGNDDIRTIRGHTPPPRRRLVNRTRSVASCLKTFKIVIINIGTICLCWAPYSVLSALSLDTDRATITYTQDFVGYCLLFLPNFVNPLVFIAFNEDYRGSVTRLWYRGMRPVRVNSVQARPRLTLVSTDRDNTVTTTAGKSVRAPNGLSRVFVRHV
ncbi:violet-sensitive opsin-like [Mizuhopecten yessoensis]|uniref:violet-sensitive opsin-like n=1 Tax=Mizuhopecten yessoensis TaxID=6573 RepID=UPI000B45824F|nr:violet-sensitive opsin-like [Mizuhopecten yessoensis]